MNRIQLDDYQSIIKSNIKFEQFKNKVFLVTGGTGYLGSFLIKSLLYCNDYLKLNLRIIAQVRNLEKAKQIFQELCNHSSLEFLVMDFCKDELRLYENVDYIIHTVAVTESKVMIQKPVETIYSSLKSIEKILEYSVENRPESIVYVSSMEMYGSVDDRQDVTENVLGVIDPLEVRSDYPESKRMSENLCVAYCNEYKVNVKIARLAQTFGSGILKGENRVFAQFARCVINSNDIVLHTTGESDGNYCYISDVIKGLLLILLEGESGNAYNIANEKMHTSIKGMAELVVNEIAMSKIGIKFDIPEKNIFGYAAPVKMKLNSSKLRALGWEPEIGLKEAYFRMIEDMKDRNI